MKLFAKLKGSSKAPQKEASSSTQPGDHTEIKNTASAEGKTSKRSPIPSRQHAKRASRSRKAPDNYEMVKRRVRVQLAILERPLMTETEFLVDARYKSVKMLGSGAYGIVVSAMDTVSGSRVAIKKILNAFTHSRMARHVLREVRLLRHLNHPHIVNLLDIDVPQQYKAWDSVYIVTTLLDTDLKLAMKAGRIDTAQKKKKIAYQMLLGLAHMHSLGVMHRDVKSKNLLVDADLNVQLCDLGESRFYSKANRDKVEEEAPKIDEPELSGVVTTMIISAPELSLGADYDAEVDIWSAGCVIAELLHPKHEYLFGCTAKQSHMQEIVDTVGYPSPDILDILPNYGAWYLKLLKKKGSEENRIAEKLGPGVDATAIDLLEKMLKFSPKQRLSAERALEHAWFDEVRDEYRIEKQTYDFALSEPDKQTSKTELKNMVWEEVVAFHPEAPNLGVH